MFHDISWSDEFEAVQKWASLHCCGLMVSSPGPCASSGGRLPEALFMVFLSDSKGAKVCCPAPARPLKIDELFSCIRN